VCRGADQHALVLDRNDQSNSRVQSCAIKSNRPDHNTAPDQNGVMVKGFDGNGAPAVLGAACCAAEQVSVQPSGSFA